MIVGIIGSRRRNSPKDYAILCGKLARLEEKHDGITKIITGDCEDGGDKFARAYAMEHKKEIDIKYKMKDDKIWNRRSCGNVSYYEFCQMCYDRNIEIAKEKMDYLVCLVAKDRTGGTEHTIKQFKRYEQNWKLRLILL